MTNRLNITPHDANEKTEKKEPSRYDRYRVQEAKFERKWLQDPGKYNPSLTVIDRVRIERIMKMIPFADLPQKRVADIGCGWGDLAQKMCQAGALCDACDIASNALKQLPNLPHLHPKKTSLPETHLEDNAYDFILCCDTIAELDPRDYRLAIAELCRLLKPEGKVLISTPLDIYAEDALDRFIKLVETEFTITDAKLSYHAFYLKITNLLNKPKNYWKAYQDPNYRAKELAERSFLSRAWLSVHSSLPLAWFWGVFQWIPIGIEKLILERKSVLIVLESLCKFLKDIQGVSHVAVMCKRKPLLSVDVNHLARPDRAPFIKEKRWD